MIQLRIISETENGGQEEDREGARGESGPRPVSPMSPMLMSEI